MKSSNLQYLLSARYFIQPSRQKQWNSKHNWKHRKQIYEHKNVDNETMFNKCISDCKWQNGSNFLSMSEEIVEHYQQLDVDWIEDCILYSVILGTWYLYFEFMLVDSVIITNTFPHVYISWFELIGDPFLFWRKCSHTLPDLWHVVCKLELILIGVQYESAGTQFYIR